MTIDSIVNSELGSFKDLLQLIAMCSESEEGYRDIADDVTDGGLASLFLDIAIRRSKDVEELQRILNEQGVQDTEPITLSSTFHRLWIGLRGAVLNGDCAEILFEADHVEHYLETYYSELRDELPEALRVCLARQLKLLQSKRIELLHMRESVQRKTQGPHAK